ncbi:MULTISPECIES: FAD-binding oxidoreductase [unclassified Ruegeria]|uniref:NAD(P)/FAD-dependent oxidoreductase n=1 Tax=unclassified Ruegeria TaxID=2625375 RepID=UPI001491DBDC|nr:MULTISPECIES: FAD-binding oxidoreductase [unclassified Ruegeria]NOD47671.1 FAD-dependent oxidoreductase [Ruegeria sp. HKCCD5849]NOD52666.1 FAD-dependent oxidoreductase [Ruegeria sp. HKCCD5851]NOD66085.1 FAD-dependent oxidoreductase [Ruegeria sp. HKCCD7303]
MQQDTKADIVVIGAGIVGISAALELQKRGKQVLVLDREGIGAGASKGNAGAFAFTDIVPLATPGIMRKAPKWLLDPLGPLSVPPAYALNIAPWMLRFWRASCRDHYAASLSAQATLMDYCRAALERQIKDVDGEVLMQRDGQLQLFEGEAEFRASLPTWDLRRDHGIPFDLLDSPDAIAEIQPGLDHRFTHAGFTPTWMNTVDPALWTSHLAAKFTARGGRVEIAGVTSLTPTEAGVRLTTASGEVSANQVIVAAGAWSHQLAKTLGDHIPLETERGYNTTLPKGAFDLRTHLTFGGHGFVVTRINDGVRVGGAVELGGLKLAPNYKRADTLLAKAGRFLPKLNLEGGKQWMGFRPSLPDSLPVIDRAARAPQVLYAFGHGHLGLTQSAGTAELIVDLAIDGKPSLDVTPYASTRF